MKEEILPELGIIGLMLGDIFGRRAGDTVTCDILCLFLLDLLPRDGFDDNSEELFVNFIPLDLGVLFALNLGVLADPVGVSKSSSSSWGICTFNPGRRAGNSFAAAGNEISSIDSRGLARDTWCPGDSSVLPGMLISIAGVAGAF